MARALGWSCDLFDPTDPGRLCRGRERWIESYPASDFPEMFRIMVSGASFSDDSARDAERGLACCGVQPWQVIEALFGGSTLLAWCEEGLARLVPEGVIFEEELEVRRPGGPLVVGAVRWVLPCAGPEDVQRALAAGADIFTVHGESPLDSEGHLQADLVDAVFLLSSFRQPGNPTRRFQPVAIPEVLAQADALVLVHEDKHAPCLGIYSIPEIDPNLVFDQLVEGTDTLSVPFAIPPMLARWDRALWELHQDWDEDLQGPFPVPPAASGGWGWSRRRRGGGSDEGEE